jgi:hypothetical protein
VDGVVQALYGSRPGSDGGGVIVGGEKVDGGAVVHTVGAPIRHRTTVGPCPRPASTALAASVRGLTVHSLHSMKTVMR